MDAIAGGQEGGQHSGMMKHSNACYESKNRKEHWIESCCWLYAETLFT